MVSLSKVLFLMGKVKQLTMVAVTHFDKKWVRFDNVTFFPRKEVTKEILRNRNTRIQSPPHVPSISEREEY